MLWVHLRVLLLQVVMQLRARHPHFIQRLEVLHRQCNAAMVAMVRG